METYPLASHCTNLLLFVVFEIYIFFMPRANVTRSNGIRFSVMSFVFLVWIFLEKNIHKMSVKGKVLEVFFFKEFYWVSTILMNSHKGEWIASFLIKISKKEKKHDSRSMVIWNNTMSILLKYLVKYLFVLIFAK